MTSLDDWNLSGHAVQRALDMAVRADEIRDCLAGPESTYTSTTEGRDGQEVWRKGRISLVVDPTDRCVITVLWALRDQWSRSDRSLSRED